MQKIVVFALSFDGNNGSQRVWKLIVHTQVLTLVGQLDAPALGIIWLVGRVCWKKVSLLV